ncbi:MAG: hypothetical protein Q8Q10_02075 [bacterium]|nr:hypothetical protein [bacterium]
MKNNSKQKEITLNGIAELIKTSANETKKSLEAKIISSASETTRVLEAKIESSASELATMTQNQFLELGKKIENIENTIKEIKSDTNNIKANLNKKVDKTNYNTLTYRVEKLEKKFA